MILAKWQCEILFDDSRYFLIFSSTLLYHQSYLYNPILYTMYFDLSYVDSRYIWNVRIIRFVAAKMEKKWWKEKLLSEHILGLAFTCQTYLNYIKLSLMTIFFFSLFIILRMQVQNSVFYVFSTHFFARISKSPSMHCNWRRDVANRLSLHSCYWLEYRFGGLRKLKIWIINFILPGSSHCISCTLRVHSKQCFRIRLRFVKKTLLDYETYLRFTHKQL
jgi:hypothetical protein